MARRIPLLLVLAVGFAVSGFAQSDDLTAAPGTVDSGSWLYQAPDSITNSGSFVVENSASVTFEAGSSIQLEPGFQAVAGSASMTFHALINPNVQSVGITQQTGQLPPASSPTKEYIHLNGKVIAVENGQ